MPALKQVKDMKTALKSRLIFIGLFLSISPCVVFAQEKEDARLEARQHYLQGEEYYSQGRYQEASSEFEKGIEALQPARIQFEQAIEKETQKAIAAPAPVEVSKKKPRVKKEQPGQKRKNGEPVAEEGPALIPAQALEATSAEGEREYYLDIGDVLDISIWQVPDLSRSEVIVRPDGRISFPLIGDIQAEGSSLIQLDDMITEKLKTYIKSPEVSIMIRRFGDREGSRKVVVLGEIFSPGVYKFDDIPTITEVIASAGGYTKYAVLNSVIVIRGDIKAKPELIRLNVANILKSGNLSQNIPLKPNDIIYVPRSFIGKLNVFMEIIQPAINEYLQTLNARNLQRAVRSKGGI